MSKYVRAKIINEEEAEFNAQQKEELNQLRKLKKKLKRDNELSSREWEKLENELHQSVQERTEMELVAQNLSNKLEKVQAEKEQLELQYNDNESAIDQWNAEIRALKTELESMKNVVANTFGKELNTAKYMQ